MRPKLNETEPIKSTYSKKRTADEAGVTFNKDVSDKRMKQNGVTFMKSK